MSVRWQRLRWLLGLAVLAAACVLLWRQLREVSFAQLAAAWRATPAHASVAAFALTGLSFACLAGYERLSTRWVTGARIPVGMALWVGAVSHALANTLGFHAVTGAAFRHRYYREFGIGLAELARIVAVVAGCVAVGVLAVLAWAAAWTQATTGPGRVLVLSGVAVLFGWFLLAARRHHVGVQPAVSVVIAHAPGLALLGLLEMGAAMGALYVLIPHGVFADAATFTMVFVGAMMLGIASHAPGGIGVFEATLLAATPAQGHPSLLAALLAYRLVYNLIPFGLAVIAVATRSLLQPRPADSVGRRV